MAGLSEQIRLEKWTSSKSNAGDFQESIQRYNLWAEVVSSGGARATQAGQTTINQTVTFRVRFRPDFKPTGNWRVVYEGKRYTVTALEKENNKRFYWLITAIARGF